MCAILRKVKKRHFRINNCNIIIKERETMKKTYFGIVALCPMFILTGCSQAETQESSVVNVKVMRVEPVTEESGWQYTGTVEESSGSVLSFPVSGTVTRIRVEAGQRVQKGELIAELDEATLQSTYDAASAALTQAEDAYRRMEQLHEAGSLPEMQWVEVQSKLKQAQSQERIAKKNLADGHLYAPFSGVISEKNVDSGHNVMPGEAVARLVKVDDVKVSVSVPENEISRITIGQEVNICVQALGGKVFPGKVAEKGIAANPLSRSYDVKALVENRQTELMPGMICTLYMVTEDEGQTFVLPSNIIQTDEMNRCFVWVNDNGKASRRIVATGRLGRDGVQITSGISAGDSVIVEGQQKVSEGMEVSIIK